MVSTYAALERARRASAHQHPLQAAADVSSTESTVANPNDGTTYKLAMRRSTRSSRDLNGSLQSTVRWAWSLSFRCTQSTV